jgi:hypothetical protein
MVIVSFYYYFFFFPAPLFVLQGVYVGSWVIQGNVPPKVSYQYIKRIRYVLETQSVPSILVQFPSIFIQQIKVRPK